MNGAIAKEEFLAQAARVAEGGIVERRYWMADRGPRPAVRGLSLIHI